tara:strand:+ start:671 stop:1273 length:603 start_codon:yes stop_codon:yes gene_type:complete
MEYERANYEIIEELLNDYDLSPRTRSFVLSLKSYDDRGQLSIKQINALKSIRESYSENTPANSWTRKWNKKKRELAEVCARYYIANPPYYNDLAHRILTNSDFIPTESQYNRLTNNKYSAILLAEYNAESEFSIGDTVYIRTPAARKLELQTFLDQPMIILKLSAAPIVSMARGAKRHMVLPLNSEVPLVIEERYLKKTR